MAAQDHDSSRRRFLRLSLLGAAALPVSTLLLQRPALAQERVKESDPVAKSLSYSHEASEVTHDAYQAGQACENCQLYSAGAGADGWGACGAFGGRLVKASGWCTAFVPS